MKRLFAYTPTLAQSWMLLALICACQLAGGLLGGALAGSIGLSWSNLVAYSAGFALMAGIVIKLGTDQQPTEDTPVAGSKADPVVYLLLLLLMPALSIVVEPLSSWIPMPERMKRLFEVMFGEANWGTFFMVAVIAPFCEEWLCRGVIMKGLLKHSTPVKAIVWSSAIFAIMHLNPWQAIPAFCLALAIGWVYYKTRSLWPCIFMHFVNNSLAFLILIIFPEMESDATMADLAGEYYLGVYTAALVLTVAIGYGLQRKLTR